MNRACCIQFDHADCDTVALDLPAKGVFLCEISQEVPRLINRLKERHDHWGLPCHALAMIALFLPTGAVVSAKLPSPRAFLPRCK